MRNLILMVCILSLATAAIADKPYDGPVNLPSYRIACPLEATTYDWDFSASDQGFTTATCDPDGGEAVWEWGAESHFGNCWGTVLAGNYPNNAGEALVSPSFLVDQTTQLVEVTHYFDTELNFDGCNLVVNGTPVTPMEGYTVPEISTSTSFYAYCVDMEPGFSGHDLDDWVLITSCFDLADFMGQTVDLRFQLGADSSVAYPGWYLANVKVGGSVVATDPMPWGGVKSLYR